MAESEPSPIHLVKVARNPDVPFGALKAISDLRELLETYEWAAIDSARAKGVSWRDIAAAMGVTRQALQQRIARRAERVGTPA